jgi:hypothetical protein
VQQPGKDHTDSNSSCGQYHLDKDDDNGIFHEDQCQARPHQQPGTPHDGGRFRKRQTNSQQRAHPSRRENSCIGQAVEPDRGSQGKLLQREDGLRDGPQVAGERGAPLSVMQVRLFVRLAAGV